MPDVDLAYPIGRFEPPSRVDAAARAAWIADIEAAPVALRRAVAGLSDVQLDTPYRPGGWTVRQVVHHVPDSHLNAYVRFKLALTEEQPTIRPYDEALWAKLPDGSAAPIEMSLALLASLHARWLACIRALPERSFERTFRHPEIGVMSLNQHLALYAWHGRHHVAHITELARRMGWAAAGRGEGRMGHVPQYVSKRKPRQCPACGSKKVLRILWGYPSPGAVKREKAGKVVLGGCLPGPDPSWQCIDCGARIIGEKPETLPGEG